MVECEEVGFNNTEICSFAKGKASFSTPSDYVIAVTGDNPNPHSFPGESIGTAITLGSGSYVISEELVSTDSIQTELRADSVTTTTTTLGDRTPNFGSNNKFVDATDTMTSGGSQECTLVNTITIN